jgi:hypothetical protein
MTTFRLASSFARQSFVFLDELEQSPGGMEESVARRRVFQVIKALAFCHANSVRMSINVVFSSNTELEKKRYFSCLFSE